MIESSKRIFPLDFTGRMVGLLFLILIPIVVLIPHNAVPVWLSMDLALRWISGLVFILCMAIYVVRDRLPVTLLLDTSDFLFVLLLSWILLSAKNSQTSFDSFYAFRTFLASTLWWFSLRIVWKRWPGLFGWFKKIFFLTAYLAGTWLLFTTMGRWFWFDYFSRFVPREGFFINPNIAAGFLGMALLWGLHLKLNREWFPWTGLGLLLVAWGLTESRGSLAAMVLVAVLYLVLHMGEIEKRISQWGSKQWLTFGVAVIFLAICLSSTVNRMLSGENADPRAYFRFDIWISSFHMIMAQPIFGFGPGTFADVYPFFRPEGYWDVFNPFAHNEFLQAAAECGIPALILILLLLWVLLRDFSGVTLKTSIMDRHPSEVRTAELAFYLILFEGLHNSVDFTFHDWSHRLVLMGLVTFALREKKRGDLLQVTFQMTQPVFRTVLSVVFLLVFWILGWGGARDFSSRIYDLKGNLAQRIGDLDQAEKYAQKSLQQRPNFMDPWNTLGAVEDVRAERVNNFSQREKYFELADEYFQRAIQCSPYASEPRENQIQSLVLRGRLDQALDLQSQLMTKGPELPNNYLDLGSILVKMGRAREALKPAQKLVDKYPYFLPGYILKAQVLELMGRKNEALNVYEEARDMLQNIHMTDPSGWVEPNIKRLKGSS